MAGESAGGDDRAGNWQLATGNYSKQGRGEVGNRGPLTPRIVGARCLDVIGRWGEATANQLVQYCANGRRALVLATLAELVESGVLKTADVPPRTSARNQHATVTVYRLTGMVPPPVEPAPPLDEWVRPTGPRNYELRTLRILREAGRPMTRGELLAQVGGRYREAVEALRRLEDTRDIDWQVGACKGAQGPVLWYSAKKARSDEPRVGIESAPASEPGH